ASRKPAKARQTIKAKRGSAPKAGRDRLSTSSKDTEVARLTCERDEALEREKATAEVLRVISSSPDELQLILDALVRSAVRFCGASDAAIHRLEGQQLRVAAHHGPLPYHPLGHADSLTRARLTGRAVLDKQPVHVTDLQIETEEFPEGSKTARKFGYRTALV